MPQFGLPARMMRGSFFAERPPFLETFLFGFPAAPLFFPLLCKQAPPFFARSFSRFFSADRAGAAVFAASVFGKAAGAAAKAARGDTSICSATERRRAICTPPTSSINPPEKGAVRSMRTCAPARTLSIFRRAARAGGRCTASTAPLLFTGNSDSFIPLLYEKALPEYAAHGCAPREYTSPGTSLPPMHRLQSAPHRKTAAPPAFSLRRLPKCAPRAKCRPFRASKRGSPHRESPESPNSDMFRSI